MIYLYLKQHKITGLKYFGRTTSRNPFKYKGSGTRWGYHCSKHGWEHVITVDVWGFDTQEACTEFALLFSRENNIVESQEFANLEIEDGINGKLKGTVSQYKRKPRVGPISDKHAAQLRANQLAWVGRKHSANTIEKMRKPKTEETRAKMKESAKTKKLKTLTCPHCGKVGKGSGMYRFHFNHCSLNTNQEMLLVRFWS